MGESPDELLKEIEDRLRSEGKRLTKPRRIVIGVLAETDKPLSAEEIRVYHPEHELDLVTVYRNLEALEELKVVQRLMLENGTNLFELTGEGEHFHHVICRICHKSERIEGCLGQEMENRAKALGFRDVTHVLEVYGICEECRDKEAP